MDITHAKLALAYEGAFCFQDWDEWAEGPESVRVVLSAPLLEAISKALSIDGIDKVSVTAVERNVGPVSDMLAIADISGDVDLDAFEPRWELAGLVFGFGGPELVIASKWDAMCRGVATLYPSEG